MHISRKHPSHPFQTVKAASKAYSRVAHLRESRIPLNVVVQHAAYEVHLTVDQVKSQVHAGKTFAQIAIARHITVQQLHVFVIHAQQQANDYWPGLGCITWQDETSNMQRDQGEAAPKGSEFTGVFK